MKCLHKLLIFTLSFTLISSCKSVYVIKHDRVITAYPSPLQTNHEWNEFTKICNSEYFVKDQEIFYCNHVIVYKAKKKDHEKFQIFFKSYWEGITGNSLDGRVTYIKIN